MNNVTGEWVAGVFSEIWKRCNAKGNKNVNWIVCDGPVDAIWIENMNTVLDDNKKLCLNSGQIITLTDRMTMMFEVDDLSYASPATVSRCGMVYMTQEDLGWRPYIKSWVEN